MQHIHSFEIEDATVERALISALLLDPSRLSIIVPHLPCEAFVEDDCRAIYMGVCELYKKAISPEEVSLSNELLRQGLYDEVGGQSGMSRFFKTATIADPVVLYKIVLDFHSRRLEIDLADKIQVRAYDRSDKNDMPARLALIQKELQRLQVLGLEDTRSLDSDDFGEYYRHLLSERESNRGVEKKLEFRWNALNKLSPSLVGGDLVILVAESGAGKTSWMGDQAEFWWKSGAHGVFYHLELPLQKMSDRRMARNSGISSRRLQDGRGGVSDEVIEGVLLEDFSFLSDEEVELIEQTILEMNSWPGSLVLKHCPGWTMSQICADARQRALSGDLDFMVIDYFNKLRVVSRHRGSYVTFDRGQDIELFKATIEELECVGVMAAQFGGAAKNMSGIRTVAHARETAELDDKCNIGLSLDRPLDQELGKRVSFCTLYVTKCNAGQEGKVELYFDGSRYRFLPGSDAVRF